ncbi:uncharacterized protein [Antedon mediterranea]|uniref:uncharacterized protein n=1 Tax=Antedon mediterranea TaxID=105859 RepID=UPI003AF61602
MRKSHHDIMADRKEIIWDVSRLALLFVAFASGITIISVILTFKGQCDGNCIILTDVKWEDDSECSDGIAHCFLIPNKPGSCSYIIKTQAAACAFSCMWFIFFIVKLVTRQEYTKFRPVILLAISSIFYAVLGFISACILHGGLHKLCKGLLSGPHISEETCAEFQTHAQWQNFGNNNDLYFIKYFHSAQITSWISCLCWLALFITSVIQLKCHGGIKPQRFENETNVVT